MIVSLVEDDMITFYEIYEVFDGLNMFDSKYERDMSEKLNDIGDGIEGLMYEIRDMSNRVSNKIEKLITITEESNEKIQKQLDGIGSSVRFGNVLSMINLYQNYKRNKLLK